LPYVCMGYMETATLISRYHVPNFDQNDEKYSVSWEPSLEDIVARVRKWGVVLECSNESLLKLIGEVGPDKRDKIKTIHDMINICGVIDKLMLKLTHNSQGLTENIESVISNIRTLQLSIESGDDINAETLTDKNNALHIAAQNNDADAILLLVEAGADISQTNDEGQTPLDKATTPACQKILKRLGANSWSPLLLSVELGQQNMKQYVRIRSVLNCIMQKNQFESKIANWFGKKVDCYVHSDYVKGWKWECFDKSHVHIDDKKVKRKTDLLECSNVLGSKLYLDTDVIVWEFYVENVCSMWLGICGGQDTDLYSSPQNYRGKYLIAFHCSGVSKENIKIGILPSIECIAGANGAFHSGDRVQFTLDPIKKSLVMKINGITTYRLNKIEISDSNRIFRAFVSMRNNESVTLCSSKCVASNLKDLLSDEYVEAKEFGLNNELWSSELDTKIRACWPKGHGPVQISQNTVVDISEYLSAQNLQACIHEWGDFSEELHKKAAAFAFRFNVLCTIEGILESMFAQSCVEDLKAKILSGFDVDAVNKDHDTALHIAVQRSSKSAVEQLMMMNADSKIVNSNGLTAFELAKSLGFEDIAAKIQELEPDK